MWIALRKKKLIIFNKSLDRVLQEQFTSLVIEQVRQMMEEIFSHSNT